jgi:mannitol/fructose-specific phosphotransferase system IIA component
MSASEIDATAVELKFFPHCIDIAKPEGNFAYVVSGIAHELEPKLL